MNQNNGWRALWRIVCIILLAYSGVVASYSVFTRGVGWEAAFYVLALAAYLHWTEVRR